MKDGINLVNGQSLSHEEINSGLREAWNERPASNPSTQLWHQTQAEDTRTTTQPERHVDDWATAARLEIGSQHFCKNAQS